MIKLEKSFYAVRVRQYICGFSEITLKFKLWKWKRKFQFHTGFFALMKEAVVQTYLIDLMSIYLPPPPSV